MVRPRAAPSRARRRLARPAPDRYVVASGFGTRAQWYHNVSTNPRVRIYLGSHRPAPATATVLTGEQGANTLAAYADAHPRAWRTSKPVERTLGAETSERGPPCHWSHSMQTRHRTAARHRRQRTASSRLDHRCRVV